MDKDGQKMSSRPKEETSVTEKICKVGLCAPALSSLELFLCGEC